MKKKNRVLSVLRIVSIVLFVLAMFLLVITMLSRKNPKMSVFGYRMYQIADTGSMEPTIKGGEIVFVKKTDPDKLKVGDIISFVSSDPAIKGMINTHRITAINNDNGTLRFITAGDAHIENGKIIDDPYPVNAKDIMGKVVKHSKAAGKVFSVLSDRKLSFCITIVPLIVIVIISIFDVAVVFYRPYDEKMNDGGKNDKNDNT